MKTHRPVRASLPAILIALAGTPLAVGDNLFPASIDLSMLNGTNGFVINGANSEDQLGRWVSGGGDVNGDGNNDLLISAPLAQLRAGKTYVIFGGVGLGASGVMNLSALNGANGFAINGAAQDDGWPDGSTRSAGDVNGDSFADLLIGAPNASPFLQHGAGLAYLVYGGPAVGASGVLNLSSFNGSNGSNGLYIETVRPGDACGSSVATAGDVNADGYDDMLVGARQADPNGKDGAGEAYLVFGGPSLSGLGSVTAPLLNGANGYVLQGSDTQSQLGFAACGVGDVNADGMPDILLGAYFADPHGHVDAGKSYVVFGGSGTGSTGIISLSNLNGFNGFVINGTNDMDVSGFAVSAAGDVNGDGHSDMLIGAFGGDPHDISNAGDTYVVFGKSGLGAGGSLDLSTLNGTNGFVIHGIAANDFSGISVSSAHDVNGDGIDDLLIGAVFADPYGRSNAGESYVVFGGSGVGGTGMIDLSALNGANGFVLRGADAFDGAGKSVSMLGDVNGDGVDDLMIGAPYADPEAKTLAGKAYVIFGRAPIPCDGDVNGDHTTNVADFNILAGHFGQSVPAGTLGDLTGDGIVNIFDFNILAFDFGCDHS